MGNLIALIKELKDGKKGLEELDEKYGIFLDFENENPVKPESSNVISQKVEEKLNNAIILLESLKNYGSGGKQILADAAAKSGVQSAQDEAWDKILLIIHSLLSLKDATDALNETVPEILEKMWGEKTSRESIALVDVLQKNNFLVVQLGKILDFGMRFDEAKMMAPMVINDITYAKRQLQIRAKTNATSADEVVNNEALQNLCRFFISPNPGLNSIIETITKFFENGKSKDEPLDLIVSFCKVSIKILDSDVRNKFQKVGTIGMIHRIMVSTALLYDHLHNEGIFVPESPISIRLIVDILEDEAGIRRKRTRSRGSAPAKLDLGSTAQMDQDSDIFEKAKNLLSVLKFSNKHLKSEATPKAIEKLFSEII